MSRQVARIGVLALGGTLLAPAWPLARQATQTPPATPTQSVPQRQPVFRGGANFVLVDVYPSVDGRIVEGLTAADFQIHENGKAQAIEQVEFIRVEPSPQEERRDPTTRTDALAQAADPRNRVFVIYLDHYHTNVSGSHAAQRPIVDLLEQVLAPNDLFGVATPHLRPIDITFGRKTESLERQLAENWFWGMRQRLEREDDEIALENCFRVNERSGVVRTGQDGAATRPLIDIITARRREDKVITHLEDLLDYLGAIREARKAMLIFTNGWLLYEPDYATIEKVLGPDEARAPLVGVKGGGNIGLGDRGGTSMTAACNAEFQRLFMLDNKRRMVDLVSRANRQNVTFYPVNPSGIEVFEETLADRSTGNPTALYIQNLDRVTFRTDSLRTLASNTDGLAVITNDLPGGIRRILNDVSAYYLLGYYSTDRRFDGGYRRIEVKINRPGVRVNARRGYYAPKSGPVSARATTEPAAAAAAPAAIGDALGTLAKFRPGIELFAHATVEGQEARVSVELASARLSEWSAGADVEVTVTPTDSGAAVSAKGRIEPGLRATLVRVPLPAGAIGPWTVTARAQGAGAIDGRVAVVVNRSAVLGDALVYRAGAGATSPLRPAADFQFRRTERVHIEWPIRAALERREARLLSRTGQPLAVPVQLTERPADKAPVLAADLVLAPLAEGEYVIEVIVGAATTPERRYFALRVVR